MPANRKYLTTSWTQRFAKITAGFAGGYLVATSFFIALSFWVNHVNVLMTLLYAGFILWAFLMVFAFLAKNGWKVWGLYLLITLVFSIIIYLGRTYHPIS
ncbi:hypothetical protein [Parapedobacter tibetensis]|uniref:hypothetical protein n=1 Tax=Parapedobacter tibetensis TaxID=2972951 RepID=UPI00214D1924|nr:hypothetical protein [Parapedobacter tibetensis]